MNEIADTIVDLLINGVAAEAYILMHAAVAKMYVGLGIHSTQTAPSHFFFILEHIYVCRYISVRTIEFLSLTRICPYEQS